MRTYARDMDTTTTFAFAGTALAALGALIFLRRRQPAAESPAAQQAESTATPQQAESSSKATETGEGSSSKSKGRASKPRTRRQAHTEEEERLANRPQLKVGQRCWHRQVEAWCEVQKVYFDDLPPYYAVRMADGSERATIRQRLDDEAERAATLSNAERELAEQRADIVAAELLAEEEKTRRSASASKGKSGAAGAAGKRGKKK
jgi:LPXTG-motif cell wall-anchored protein